MIIALALVTSISGMGLASPTDCTSCGDADGDGIYTVADIAYITAFLYAGGPAPAECADIDGFDLITLRDVVAGGTMASPLCVTQPKIVAQPTFNCGVGCTGLVPPNVSVFTVPIIFGNGFQPETIKIKAFDLPMLVRVNGEVPISLSASEVGVGWPGGGVNVLIDSSLGSILVYDLDGAVGHGDYVLFKLTVGVTPSPSVQQLTIVPTELGPWMTGVFAPPNSACHYAMVVQEDLSVWLPSIGTGCLCGDADNSGLHTISDVVYIINYIFAGGPAPMVPCLGDADGNAMISISDAVFLIGYIFVGGITPNGC